MPPIDRVRRTLTAPRRDKKKSVEPANRSGGGNWPSSNANEKPTSAPYVANCEKESHIFVIIAPIQI